MLYRRRLLSSTLLALLVLAQASAAAAAPKDPTPTAAQQRGHLQTVIAKVRSAARRGERPMVIVDIDDTVLDRRELHGLARGGGNHEVLARHRGHSSQFDQMLTALQGKVGRGGDAALERDLFYLLGARGAHSTKVSGSRAYLRAIERAGGQVVFVTARQKSWRADTRTALAKVGLLLGHGNRRRALIMRPDGFRGSAQFKEAMVQRIGGKRRIVALFDDKPKNLRSMKRAAPDAIAVQVTFKPDRGTHVGGDVLISNFEHRRLSWGRMRGLHRVRLRLPHLRRER